ncbi:unnamed protein product [Sphagnum balticum]
MATTRAILQVFENYQKARNVFVDSCVELNMEVLQNAGVVQLLKPLLLDYVPVIQQTAALGLCMLANYNEKLAESLVTEGILEQLVYSLNEAHRLNKKAAACILRAVAKHSPPLSQAVVNCGAIQPLISILAEFDPAVKEVAAGACGQIARHTPQLSQYLVDTGVITPLFLAIQEPELPLRRTVASAFSEIAKHTPELAQAVVDCGLVPFIAPLLSHLDQKLKREVCAVLSSVARHSTELAQVVVAGNVFPKIFLLLKDTDPMVRRNAASVIREVCKHTAELAILVLKCGGVAALVDNVSEVSGPERLPGVMALGHIASFSDSLASSVISANALLPLLDSLTTETEDHIKSASAWTLGQIGKHTPVHAKAVAEVGVLPQLLYCFSSKRSSEDLQTKSNRAMSAIINCLDHPPALDCLLQGRYIPEPILKYIIAKIAKLVPNDGDFRTKLVNSGSFSKLQQIQMSASSDVKELIDNINKEFPIELVHFYNPKHATFIVVPPKNHPQNLKCV